MAVIFALQTALVVALTSYSDRAVCWAAGPLNQITGKSLNVGFYKCKVEHLELAESKVASKASHLVLLTAVTATYFTSQTHRAQKKTPRYHSCKTLGIFKGTSLSPPRILILVKCYQCNIFPGFASAHYCRWCRESRDENISYVVLNPLWGSVHSWEKIQNAKSTKFVEEKTYR